MNPTLQKYWNDIKDRWGKFTPTQKVGLGVISGLIATAVGVSVLVARHDPYQLLYSDLQTEDFRAIAKKLSEQNLPYRVTEDHTGILVPTSKVHEARMQLAKEGLPGGQDVVGFEKFDNSTLGMSSYVQRIQYIRAVQGELIRSIQKLEAVKRARVHLSIPPKKTFLEEEDPPKASVMVELKQGKTLTKAEVVGVAHLVASAVEGLKVNQVTVVDTNGNFLHRPEDADSQAISLAILEMQRSIETEYEKRIVEMLTPIVGFGKIKAKVTAEMDASRSNTTEETFDPEKSTPKSTVKNDEVFRGSRPNPVGIPGSRTNLPGAEAQNPGTPMANSSTEKNTQNTNFAIPRKVQVTDKPSGNIKRLTVAVIVDGLYTKSGKGADTFAPRPEEELKRIQDLVGNAVGYDTQRRDSITVSSLPFNKLDIGGLGEPENVSWWKQDSLLRQLLQNGLIALTVFLFFMLVVRPVMKFTMAPEEAPLQEEMTMLPKTIAELEAAQQLGQPLGSQNPELLGAASSQESVLDEPESPEKKEEEELRKRILDKINQTPKKGMRIVQEWLDEGVFEMAQAA